MQYEAFITRAQKALSLEDRQRTVEIVEAVLVTLARRLEPAARADIAAQLGGGLKEMFPEGDEAELIPLEEYYNRVAARAELGRSDAVDSANEVIQVLKEALSEGEFEDLADELPRGYAPLLGHVEPSEVGAS